MEWGGVPLQLMTPRALKFLPLLLALTVGLMAQQAEPAAEPEMSFPDRLREAGVKVISGPATVGLGSVAEIKLPADHHAIDAGSLKRFYELTRNSFGGDEVGVVIAPQGWMLFFEYRDTGYVKDDEKDKLDAAALLKQLQEGQEAANQERVRQGWDEMRMAGWVEPPYYDPVTHNLKWALKLTSSSDNHQTPWINESIRLLGRGGVMNVTLVTDPDAYAIDARSADTLLAQNFSYVAGQRYAEFREGDKVAKYGLSALVLGGAGALAYKVGFLQKFWKLLVAGAVAVAALAKRLLNRITGKNPA